MILLTIQLTDVGIVAHGVKIVFTEDLSINWVPVLRAERGVGEIGTHLNPSSDYNRTVTSKVGRGISQSEITITETLGDDCGEDMTAKFNARIITGKSYYVQSQPQLSKPLIIRTLEPSKKCTSKYKYRYAHVQ